MIETKQLKYFVTAAGCRSFGEAAKKLYTTQPSVSKVISSLEEELGYALFIRGNNGITLSEQGALFYQRAARLTEELASLHLPEQEPDPSRREKAFGKIEVRDAKKNKE